jgi:pyruvate kinase
VVQEALDTETDVALARSLSATSMGSNERETASEDLAAKLGSSVSLNRQNLGPLLSKLESIASSAVRAADKVGASLIIVYTQSGARPVRSGCNTAPLLASVHCYSHCKQRYIKLLD